MTPLPTSHASSRQTKPRWFSPACASSPHTRESWQARADVAPQTAPSVLTRTLPWHTKRRARVGHRESNVNRRGWGGGLVVSKDDFFGSTIVRFVAAQTDNLHRSCVQRSSIVLWAKALKTRTQQINHTMQTHTRTSAFSCPFVSRA